MAVGEEILVAMKVEEEAKARQRTGKSADGQAGGRGNRKAFACPKCSEPFAEPVWHCDNCDHHEQMHVDLCQHCYDGKRPEAKENLRATCPKVLQDESARTSAIAAEASGLGRKSYEKAKAVVDAAAAEPEKYRPLVDEMNRTGKVDGALPARPEAGGGAQQAGRTSAGGGFGGFGGFLSEPAGNQTRDKKKIRQHNSATLFFSLSTIFLFYRLKRNQPNQPF